MLKNRGLAFKLIILFILSSTFIFLLIFGYNYYTSRGIIEKNLKESSQNLALETVNRIEIELRSVQKIPENMAYFLEHSSFTKERLLNLIRMVVENNPEIYGVAVAFEPYAFNKKLLYFAPYFYKTEIGIRSKNLEDIYKYLYWDWYQIPKELNRPEWSEPYYDEGAGNIIMATYSVPFYKNIGGERQFMGIVTADVALEWLSDIVSSIKILKTGYGFLISKNGTIVTHPLKNLIMNETIFYVAEDRHDIKLREIGRDMIKGGSGFVPYMSIIHRRPCWMYYTPISSSGWSLAVIFPLDEMTEDISRLNKIVIFLGVLGLLLLSFTIVLITRSITKPLRVMVKATEDIGKGNFDIEIPPVKSGDEVGKLADSFSYMKTSLKDYINNLTHTTAVKERIENELKIAYDIQMGILPKQFPPFPDRTEVDIYAEIKPAKEVGGDFYDFFFIDNNHLCFVIGDVSDKGVPAAIFMAVTKTLIKAIAAKGIPPGEILTKVNKELFIGNDSNMFVTIFCGILDTKTGEVLYTNAGHNQPLLIKKGEDVLWIDGEKNIIAGIIEHFNYKTERLILNPGDMLFIYTDGVTEAMNENDELFSNDRLRKEVIALQKKSMQEIVGDVIKKVMSFTHGTPQSDDITVMILKFIGK